MEVSIKSVMDGETSHVAMPYTRSVDQGGKSSYHIACTIDQTSFSPLVLQESSFVAGGSSIRQRFLFARQ